MADAYPGGRAASLDGFNGAVPVRSRRRGTIINVSSFNGVVAMPSLGYYSATKFALEGLTEALAPEVAPLGIKVMFIEPRGIAAKSQEHHFNT